MMRTLWHIGIERLDWLWRTPWPSSCPWSTPPPTSPWPTASLALLSQFFYASSRKLVEDVSIIVLKSQYRLGWLGAQVTWLGRWSCRQQPGNCGQQQQQEEGSAGEQLAAQKQESTGERSDPCSYAENMRSCIPGRKQEREETKNEAPWKKWLRPHG